MKMTLEGISHKLGMAKELHAVVRTMKALSASNLQQYENAVKAMNTYTGNIRRGLWVCMQFLPMEEVQSNPQVIEVYLGKAHDEVRQVRKKQVVVRRTAPQAAAVH